jgi:hypothetical protein
LTIPTRINSGGILTATTQNVVYNLYVRGNFTNENQIEAVFTTTPTWNVPGGYLTVQSTAYGIIYIGQYPAGIPNSVSAPTNDSSNTLYTFTPSSGRGLFFDIIYDSYNGENYNAIVLNGNGSASGVLTASLYGASASINLTINATNDGSGQFQAIFENMPTL